MHPLYGAIPGPKIKSGCIKKTEKRILLPNYGILFNLWSRYQYCPQNVKESLSSKSPSGEKNEKSCETDYNILGLISPFLNALAMCQCGLHALLWSHIGTFIRFLAEELRSTAGLLYLNIFWPFRGKIFLGLYSMVWVFRVSRTGPIPFYWPSCSLSFCLLLFSLSLLSFYGLVLWRWGLRTDRVFNRSLPALHCQPLLIIIIIIIIIIIKKLKNSNLSSTSFLSSFPMSQKYPTIAPHQKAIVSSTSSLIWGLKEFTKWWSPRLGHGTVLAASKPLQVSKYLTLLSTIINKQRYPKFDW